MGKTVVVHYLGPEGTHSHEAALQFASLLGDAVSSVKAQPQPSIEAVVRTVSASGHPDVFGCLPLENSIQGSVTQTWDALLQDAKDNAHGPHIQLQASITLPIHHYLLTTTKTTSQKKIEEVLSHPQALMQCKKWLLSNTPQALCTPAASTADAARTVAHSGRENIAAIAGRAAAEVYGLHRCEQPIEDETTNVTRFGLIGFALPQVQQIGVLQKSSLCLLGVSNRPGGLLRALEPFDRASFNLTRIESRPIGQQLGEYAFFLDVETPQHTQGEGKDGWTEIAEVMEMHQIDVIHLGVYTDYTELMR